jgi:hypothetical protein
MSVEVLTHPALAGAAHGFLGRRGGVSTGIHAGLNVGWGSEARTIRPPRPKTAALPAKPSCPARGWSAPTRFIHPMS